MKVCLSRNANIRNMTQTATLMKNGKVLSTDLWNNLQIPCVNTSVIF